MALDADLINKLDIETDTDLIKREIRLMPYKKTIIGTDVVTEKCNMIVPSSLIKLMALIR